MPQLAASVENVPHSRIRELAEIDQKHVTPQRKSFFEKIRNLFGSGESKQEGEKSA